MVFELNGDWFNHHYKGGPVDYWGGKLPHYGPGLKGRYSEMEDRVFSDEPFIPLPKDPKESPKDPKDLKKIKNRITSLIAILGS